MWWEFLGLPRSFLASACTDMRRPSEETALKPNVEDRVWINGKSGGIRPSSRLGESKVPWCDCSYWAGQSRGTVRVRRQVRVRRTAGKVAQGKQGLTSACWGILTEVGAGSPGLTEVLSLYTDGDHLERFKGALNLGDEKQFCPGLDWGDMAEMCYQEALAEASVNFKDE